MTQPCTKYSRVQRDQLTFRDKAQYSMDLLQAKCNEDPVSSKTCRTLIRNYIIKKEKIYFYDILANLTNLTRERHTHIYENIESESIIFSRFPTHKPLNILFIRHFLYKKLKL